MIASRRLAAAALAVACAACAPELREEAASRGPPTPDVRQQACVDLLDKMRHWCAEGLGTNRGARSYDCLDARVRLQTECF